MTQIHLNFYQRVTLWSLIGNYQARNLKETSVFLRVLDKVRPNDEEMREAQFVADGSQFRWRLPDVNYGDRDLDLEKEEAEGLASALESQQGVRVADAAWMFAPLDQLKPAS